MCLACVLQSNHGRPVRVVNVCSKMHELAPGIELDDPHFAEGRGYSSLAAYNRSKLAQVGDRPLSKSSHPCRLPAHTPADVSAPRHERCRFMTPLPWALHVSFTVCGQEGGIVPGQCAHGRSEGHACARPTKTGVVHGGAAAAAAAGLWRGRVGASPRRGHDGRRAHAARPTAHRLPVPLPPAAADACRRHAAMLHSFMPVPSPLLPWMPHVPVAPLCPSPGQCSHARTLPRVMCQASACEPWLWLRSD